ncbi:DUF1801 domain-containing protein [uncultured Flavobacterium sp.]|uniref:YdeI/OmpD-associated family protein n=1 Tax=uncultured Flavobacterium sp. TaxID=165435 RepID=UPI0025E77299|nr:DUF1801 domain-containing protein [uncultured Flavobacterium sp.]
MEKETKVWDKAHRWETELEALQSIFAKTELVQTIKWGAPTYTINGKNVLGIGGFTSYFTIWFYKGVFLKDPAGVLVNAQEGTTRSLRQWRFSTKGEIDEKLILHYVNEAIAIEKAGMAIRPQKKELAVPEVLQRELEGSAEMAAAFAAFKPYRQNEFLEYIISAKRLATQLARLEKIKPMILQGRGLNDKYR